jgi:phosphoenolpyruvate carboxykinase (ATP)
MLSGAPVIRHGCRTSVDLYPSLNLSIHRTGAIVLAQLYPFSVNYLTNPDQQTLRSLALEHTPAVFESRHGNLVKVSRNKARQAKFTYVIADDGSDRFSQKTITRAEALPLIARQQKYIEAQGQLIEVQGFLGTGPRAVGVQWLYTVEGANIAGMQSVLAFPVDSVLNDSEHFSPEFRVIYTPNCFAYGMPGEQAIIVDLENYTTYIMGPDYFGESKKAALRMLNERVYQSGGLVLHAGAKKVKIGEKTVAMTIMGLSGTGKTTTTFSKQGDVTEPIQDDMVALWPKGELSITENGCFAKTHGLSADSEPVIYEGTLSSDAWVENVYLAADGAYDFFKDALAPQEVERLRDTLVVTGAPAANVDAYIRGDVELADLVDSQGVVRDGWDFVRWTGNGRSIIPMSAIEDAANLNDIPEVRTMGILNRDEGSDAATPGIIRFTSPQQAAGYFMLGETTKTSAAGKEVGKTRSPFTQPFFPLAHGLQARRFSELAETMPDVSLWMMNTGYVGGDAKSIKQDQGYKVKIRHSSAMLEAMLKDEVVWKRDPDFGYEVVDIEHPQNLALLQRVPADILDPRRYYDRTGRSDEYMTWVQQMKTERRQFLNHYGVDGEIVDAVCG